MRPLNNNIILKKIENKGNKKDNFISTTVRNEDTVVLEVVSVPDESYKDLIGRKVLVGRYAGTQHEDVLICPYSTLLAVL